MQKILAHAGIGSRRACEELILQGRVTVGGQVVRELGTRVDLKATAVAVDGQKIQQERLVYFAVNKPKGYVSTNNDPSGRPRVLDILPEIPQRVYTVGRLDEMSVGLLLLTNDGELANKLAHPKFGVEKLYRVIVAGLPERDVLNQLTEGIWLAEGKVRAKRVRIVSRKGEATILELVLAEGKNREVRRMLAKLGHKVMSLTRVAVGPITLKGLTSGQFRPLTGREVDLLRRVAAGEAVPMPWNTDRRSRPEATADRPPRAGGPGASGPRPEGQRQAHRPGGDRPANVPHDGPRRPFGGGGHGRSGPGTGLGGPHSNRRHEGDRPQSFGPRGNRPGSDDRRHENRPPRPVGGGGPRPRPGMFQAPLDDTQIRDDRPTRRPTGPPLEDRGRGPGPGRPHQRPGPPPRAGSNQRPGPKDRAETNDRPGPGAIAGRIPESGGPPRRPHDGPGRPGTGPRNDHSGPRPSGPRRPPAPGSAEPSRRVIGATADRTPPPPANEGSNDRPRPQRKRPAPRAAGGTPRPAPRRRPGRRDDD